MWNVCGAGTVTKRRRLAACDEVVDIPVQGKVGQPVGVVGEEHLVVADIAAEPVRRSPIIDVRPVSTNVIFQSSMSVLSSSTSAAASAEDEVVGCRTRRS